jgi:hypothetical protein
MRIVSLRKIDGLAEAEWPTRAEVTGLALICETPKAFAV